MKRAWATLNAVLTRVETPDGERRQVQPNPYEGDERAQEVALALAAISDVDFLRSVLNAKGSMDQFGGQVVIAAKRERIDGQGCINPEGAERVTIAYAFSYQHVADALRDEREPDSRPHQIDWGAEESNGNGPEQPPEDEPAPEEAELPEEVEAMVEEPASQ